MGPRAGPPSANQPKAWRTSHSSHERFFGERVPGRTGLGSPGSRRRASTQCAIGGKPWVLVSG